MKLAFVLTKSIMWATIFWLMVGPITAACMFVLNFLVDWKLMTMWEKRSN